MYILHNVWALIKYICYTEFTYPTHKYKRRQRTIGSRQHCLFNDNPITCRSRAICCIQRVLWWSRCGLWLDFCRRHEQYELESNVNRGSRCRNCRMCWPWILEWIVLADNNIIHPNLAITPPTYNFIAHLYAFSNK